MKTRVGFCYIHSAPRVSGFGDELGRFIQERFICCCCAFGHCAWIHPPELTTYSQGRKVPELESTDSVSIDVIYRLTVLAIDAMNI